MNAHHTTRRTFLGRTAAITGVAIAASLPASQFLASPAYAADKDPAPARVREAVRRAQARNRRVLTGKTSHNGWEMERVADEDGAIYTRPVPGTPLEGIAVRLGDVETVLVHVVRRFHYEVDELRKGDVVGWRSPGTVRKGLAESNQASGTAVQIRPGHYPSGARGGFYPQQLLVIRDILAELDGVVRWGGDDRKPDESLFSIDVGPGDERLAQVAAKLHRWSQAPGAGAGAPVDVTSTKRRKAARTLADRQRAAA
ncbi:twin-arginine translocation signal domain-containing protein [Streptomyces sp. KM273126]|uniref:twin-arginine translocation signal domain-containing protein n=1 Tax=Streptomyces sp. KM273126 TaxID=2545247 RepID=UPI001040D86A|nr:twin-arginine translocation signal domain-containing protein [Streptomyces sp. KM273126]MBA2808713.1 twin-arginine translocation signal domain-containing protein [Streptomyces sp. KM273126]